MKLIDNIYDCPLCGMPVCEAPKGSSNFACISWKCPYMTHYGWKKEDYEMIDGEWYVKGEL